MYVLFYRIATLEMLFNYLRMFDLLKNVRFAFRLVF